MADIARGLVLPGLGPPAEADLKTLLLYYDQLVIPDYVERSRDEAAPRQLSDVERRLQQEGLLEVPRREVDASSYTFTSVELGEGEEQGSLEIKFKFDFPEELAGNYATALEELSDQARTLETRTGWEFIEFLEKAVAVANPQDAWYAWCAQVENHYLSRMRDATELAADEHLAQIALSVVEHVGAMAQAESGDDLASECSLLTAVIQSFAIDPSTPLDDILAFRVRHQASVGRLRAAVSDLAAGLGQDVPARRALAAGRDVYLNRVVPALGDLEGAMKENAILFGLRSILGASAIAIGSVAPVVAAEQGAELAATALNYRFSRKKLVREHPFGYLYRMRRELGAFPVRATMESVRVMGKTAHPLRELLLQQDPQLVVDAFLGGGLRLMPRLSGDWPEARSQP